MPKNNVQVVELKEKIDFGIITIREDEFQAVLNRFPLDYHAVGGNRSYAIHRLNLTSTDYYLIAIVRCIEPGEGEAQDVARDMIEDLDPQWILLVGIAGAVPEFEFSLGDVVVATRLLDFSVGAAIEGGSNEIAVAGGPMHKKVQVFLAQLPAMESQIQGWNEQEAIGEKRPPVEMDSENFYGSTTWQRKVKDTLKKHFKHTSAQRLPLFTTAAIASSNLLIKDTTLISEWEKTARQIRAVEMELAGVYQAARRINKEYPILAIRGISDIVGFKRHHDWTTYACHSAASFSYACLKTNPIPSKISQDNITEQILCKENPIIHYLSIQELSNFISSDIFIDKENISAIDDILINQKARRILISGDSGRGKTVLSKIYSYLKEQEHWLIFFIDIREVEYKQLLNLQDEIELLLKSNINRNHILFVFENCHNSEEITNNLRVCADKLVNIFSIGYFIFISRDFIRDVDIDPFYEWKKSNFHLQLKPKTDLVINIINKFIFAHKCNRSHYSLSLFPDYITNLEVNERRVLSEAAC